MIGSYYIFLSAFSLFHGFAYALNGQWRVVGNSSVVAIHSALLNPPNLVDQNGMNSMKILMWERFHGLHAPSLYPANPFTYVPSIGQSELTCLCTFHLTDNRVSHMHCEPKHAPFSPFCAGSAQSSSGKVLVFSGDGDNVGQGYIQDGRQAVQYFDPVSEQWTHEGTLESTRWYPTVVTLNNRQIIIGGHKESYVPTDPFRNNPTMEFWPKPGNQRELQLLIPNYPYNTYPLVFTLPQEQTFVFSGVKASLLSSHSFDVQVNLPDLIKPNLKPSRSFPFTANGAMFPLWPSRQYATQVMICGGTMENGEAGSNCDKMVFSGPNASNSWVTMPDMPIPRVMGDSVLLPNGKILYINGAKTGTADGPAGYGFASNPSFESCLFDPETGTWEVGPAATVPRLYHSSALLLPTGEIMTAGSDQQNYRQKDLEPFEYRVEVFGPDYGPGPQPRILSLNPPSHRLGYGQIVDIEVEGDFVSNERSIVMVRYGTSTHSTNMDQRLVGLEVLSSMTIGNGMQRIQVRMPPNAHVAPDGPWMLFVNSVQGRPSIARTVLLN